MTELLFEFRIYSWWRVATGEALSGRVDTVCARDNEALPFIPAKQVRGLFREAVRDAIELEWISEPSVLERLFGSRTQGEGGDTPEETDPGCLRFESALIPDPHRGGIKEHADLLFRTRKTTAMENGVAKNKSLRTDEVVIPISLVASARPLEHLGAPPDNWQTYLKEAAPLIRAIGQKRTRGLGRCSVHALPGEGRS